MPKPQARNVSTPNQTPKSVPSTPYSVINSHTNHAAKPEMAEFRVSGLLCRILHKY